MESVSLISVCDIDLITTALTRRHTHTHTLVAQVSRRVSISLCHWLVRVDSYSFERVASWRFWRLRKVLVLFASFARLIFQVDFRVQLRIRIFRLVCEHFVFLFGSRLDSICSPLVAVSQTFPRLLFGFQFKSSRQNSCDEPERLRVCVLAEHIQKKPVASFGNTQQMFEDSLVG